MRRELVHIEILRVIAICFVVFNHTWTSGFMLYSAAGRSYRYYELLLFLSILCKIAVPIFFMISGALLLGREESYRELYTKRVARILITLILFSFLNCCYKWGREAGGVGAAFRKISEKFHPADFLRGVYSQEQAIAYWYLYAYLAFLVMLPLLRKMVRMMRAADYGYLAALQILFVGVLPIFEYLLWHGESVLHRELNVVFATTAAVFYPLMGYALEHVVDKQRYTGKNVLLLAAAAIIAIAICGALTTNRIQVTGEKEAEVFHNTLISLPTCSVYFTVKWLCEKYRLPEWFRKAAATVGSTVFGIMLLEEVLRREWTGLFEYLKPIIGIFPACAVWVMAVVVSGAALSWIIKRIPGLRRLL